jgi:hypothetical protein
MSNWNYKIGLPYGLQVWEEMCLRLKHSIKFKI